jgi:hypothetical protein
MKKKRNGQLVTYDPTRNCIKFGEVEIFELEEFLGLQLRWRSTNTFATYDQKEIEWNRICYIIRVQRMYEWREDYIAQYFEDNGKMYLPNKYYQRLLGEIKA